MEEYGMIGAVVVSLLSLTGLLVKWLMSHISAVTTAHTKERDEWRKYAAYQSREHKVERREWRDNCQRTSAVYETRLEEICKHLRG